MLIPFTPYSLWLFGVALLLFWVTIILWQRSVIAHEPLGLTLSAGGWWALLYGMELATVDEPTKLFWFCLKYIGITTIAPWCALFVLEYTRSPLYRDKRVIYGLTWLSLLTFLVIWTNEWHHLFFRAIEVVDIAGSMVVQTEKGPFYWSHVLFTYSLFLVSVLYFLHHLYKTKNNFREQLFLVSALFVPWSANILHQFNFDPFPGLDLGPFALAISGLSITWVLFDMRLMDFVPINASLIFNAVSDGIILLDAHHKIVAINPTAREMLGDSVEYAVGQPLTRIIPSAAPLSSTPLPGEQIEFQWRDQFFELRQMQLTFRFRQPNGQLLVLTEVTQRKKSELEREELIQQLQSSLSQSRALYRSSRAVIGLDDLPTQLQAVTDEIFVVFNVNQVLMILASQEQREISLLVQARPQQFQPIVNFEDLYVYPLVAQALATSQLVIRDTTRVPFDDEPILAVVPIRYRSEKMGVVILYDENNHHRTLTQQEGQTLVAMAGHTAIAISNSRLFEEVHQLATTDGLTGLYNRRHFLGLAEQTFQFAKHHSRPLAVLLMDVDLFKQINDRHGHTTGDEVLRGIATLLEANLPEEGMVGRYGGEEFVVLLPQTHLNDGLEVAEQLRRRVATTIFPTAKGPVTTTISLGVAEISPDLPSFLALLDQADAALYQAKAEGRNRVIPIEAAGQ